MSKLYVSLLGSFRALLDGQPLAGFESDKVRALLAFLMVESERPHRREELAGLLWPERPEAVARQNLSQALSNLRRVIHDQSSFPPFLDISHQTLRFNPTSNYELDTSTFLALLDGCSNHLYFPHPYCPDCITRIRQAIELYVGPFFFGFSLKGCPAFEEWVLLQQEHFEHLAIQALQCLSEWHNHHGSVEQAVDYTRRWLELDPWQERAHRQMMGMLARSGQRNAALSQYETCRAVLARELSIEPEAETQQMYAAIRDGSLTVEAVLSPSSLDIPVPMFPLLGRENELAAIESFLGKSDSRLLSLVGPGGSGKTHLALEASLRMGEAYNDGAITVGLSAVQTVDAIVPAIAQACRLNLQSDRPAQRQLLDYLRGKEMLLVLDNLEHLLAAKPSAEKIMAGFIQDILRTAPRVHILTTSRVRLNMYSEHLLHISGLPVPEPDAEEATLASFSSIQLFLATVRRVRSNYTPDNEDLRAIANLCRLLSGMPLAILLAASWIEVLEPAQILEQVARRYDFLETQWHDLPPRQRSVRAVLDHSWELLSNWEKGVFPGLAVFRGGFTAAAAEQVLGVSLGDLIRLVGKSFLVHVPGGRYEMHELLRQYAEEKLVHNADEVYNSHSTYFLAIAQRLGEDLKGVNQGTRLAELEIESENLRKAWEWQVAQGNFAGLGQLLDSQCWLYERHGRCEEGTSLCSSAIDQLLDTTQSNGRRLLARLLAWQATFERMAGRLEQADQLARQSLVILESDSGDTRSIRAFTLCVQGEIAYRVYQRKRAGELYNQSLALYQALDDPWNSARLLYDLGVLAFSEGQIEDAERWLKTSLQLRRKIGDRAGIAETLLYLCNSVAFIGHLTQGELWAREAFHIYKEMNDRAGLARTSYIMANVLCWSGQFHKALPLLEDYNHFTAWLGQQSELAWAKQSLHWTQMNLGKYEQARLLLESTMAFFQETGNMEGMAYGLLEEGYLTLLAAANSGLQVDFEAAYRYAEQSLMLFHKLNHNDEGLAWAELGYAENNLGRKSEARRHLAEALQAARRIKAPQTMVVSLAHLAAILADSKPEQAVELYTLACRHPYVGSSHLWKDLLLPEIASAAACLPPAVVKAAKTRAEEEDWEKAAENWLEKLRTDQPVDRSAL